jgi:hypothetical protein
MTTAVGFKPMVDKKFMSDGPPDGERATIAHPIAVQAVDPVATGAPIASGCVLACVQSSRFESRVVLHQHRLTADIHAMRHDRLSDQPGRPTGRTEARASNFFHPVANAPWTSRRALRAERRRQRRAGRRIRPLTVAVVLLTVFGVIALIVMSNALHSLH